MLYLYFMLTDALTGSSQGEYVQVRDVTYFTLYDNVTIRRAKITMKITSNVSFKNGTGTNLGSITPCNPTNDVTIWKSGTVLIRASTDGILYGVHTGNYSAEYVSSQTGTYYWTY